MHTSVKKAFILLSTAGLFLAQTGRTIAEENYPLRPVIIVVPFAAGGPTDLVARTIAPRLAEALEQQVTIENVVGSGGAVAAMRVKRAPGDGYTIMMGHLGTHAVAPIFNPRIGYDPIGDFEPIGLVTATPVLIVARKDFPANNLAEFIGVLKKGQYKMGHAGIGSVSYSFGVLLNQLVGTKSLLRSFNGTGPALDALVRGEVDYLCDQIVNVVPRVRENSVRAYATSTAQRNESLSKVPTSVEVGLPDFKGSAWNALFAPKGTPKNIVKRLNAALAEALLDPAIRARLVERGAIVRGEEEQSADSLATLLRLEAEKWSMALNDLSLK